MSVNLLQIPSLTMGDKICYEIDHEYRYSSGCKLHDRVVQFDTYGDGTTKHSPSYHTSAGNAWDFLQSLLKVVADDSKMDNDTLEFFRWEIGYDMRLMNVEDAQFLSTIIYDGEKRYRYFSLEAKKISGAESKKHDKRWFQIPDWADGKPINIVGLWNLAHGGPRDNLLANMGLWSAACDAVNSSWQFAECQYFRECFGDDKADKAKSLFELVRDIIETRSQLAWRISRAKSMNEEALKPIEKPVTETVQPETI